MRAHLLGGTEVPRIPEPIHLASEPEAISIPETCRRYGIGRSKLYELIRDGVVPTVKLGKRRLVRPETMRRVLASLEHTGIARAS
jgi:excisionase family DNA binding protein